MLEHPGQGGTAYAAFGVSLEEWFRYWEWLSERIIKRLLDHGCGCGFGGFVDLFGLRRRGHCGGNHHRYRYRYHNLRLQQVPPCEFAAPAPSDVHIAVEIVVPLVLSSPDCCLSLLPQHARTETRKRTRLRQLPQHKERSVAGRKPSVS